MIVLKKLVVLSLIIFFASTSLNLEASNVIDSLQTLVENSTGKLKIEYQIKLSKKLIEFSKVLEGINVAGDILKEAKVSGDTKVQTHAYSILSRGYLIAGDFASAIKYADSTMILAKATNDKYGLGLAYQAVGTPKMYTGDAEGALANFDSSLVIFDEKTYPIENAVSKLLIGSTYASTGSYDKSFSYLNESKQTFKDNGDFYKAATIDLNIGIMKGSILGQYTEAINISLAVLPYFESAGDSLKISMANSTIANCYDATGNYDKAIQYYEAALRMIGSTGNVMMQANFINNLGEVYKHKEDYESAFKYYKKALEIFEKYQIAEGITVAQNNLGECLLATGKYDEALTYFNKSLSKVDQENDNYKATIIFRNLGKVYLATGKYNMAINSLKKSIVAAKKMGSSEELYPAYENISEAYFEIGNYKEAYSYRKLYSEAKDEFNETSNAEKIANLEMNYQNVKKEKEIESLTKNQQIQELQLSNQRVLVWGLLGITLIIGIFGVIIYKRYRDNRKLNLELEERNLQIEEQKNELKKYNEQLSYTNERLVVSESDLKKLNATKDKFFSIIAHDLKGPFSSLLGLTEILAGDISDISEEQLKEMSTGVHNASRKVYALTENLLEWSRAQLNMLNVKRELFDFNELVNDNARLFKNNLTAKQISLTRQLSENSMVNSDRDMVDFVLRNLLNNAIKFTGTEGEISILSKVENNSLTVDIKDTGIGIAEDHIDKLFKIESTFTSPGTYEEKGTGLGLILVKEFIEKIGGSIFVKSKLDLGTTFTFTIPMSAEA